jgi:hypothetical protein
MDMSPPGMTPEWSSDDYFDDDGADLQWPPRNTRELRAAVGKSLATAAHSQEELAKHVRALSLAATRLEQAAERTSDPYLAGAREQLRQAAVVVNRARTLLQETLNGRR